MMNSNTNFHYGDAMAELERILTQLKQAETDLDKAIELHTKGKQLVAELERYIQNAELDIRKKGLGA